MTDCALAGLVKRRAVLAGEIEALQDWLPGLLRQLECENTSPSS